MSPVRSTAANSLRPFLMAVAIPAKSESIKKEAQMKSSSKGPYQGGFRSGLICIAMLLMNWFGAVAQPLASGTISGPALTWIDSQVQANRLSFYVYKDADSGFNHGFPSGWFPNNATDLSKLHIDTACVYDHDRL